jgi:hypothetical protein
MVGDPTEGAMIVAAAAGATGSERRLPAVQDMPFDPTQRMITINQIHDLLREDFSLLYSENSRNGIITAGAGCRTRPVQFHQRMDDHSVPLDETQS